MARAPLPKGPAGDAPAAKAAAVPAAAAAAPAAPVVMAPPLVPAACCAAPCEEHLKKVCVGETATRPKTTRVYGESCEDFCTPKCSFFGGLLGGHGHKDCGCADGGCGGCSDGHCTDCEHHARVRKYLVVRIKTEEECYNKCHVEYQPEEAKCCKTPLFHKQGCCAEGGCAGVILPPASAPMPPVEKLPPPK